MDDIAAMAATSKTVFYRHFTDRSGLYAAVSHRVDENIMRDVTSAAGHGHEAHHGGRAVIAAAIDAYLRLVEEEPEIYRFVVAAPLLERGAAGDPSAPVSAHIAEQISVLLDATLGWTRSIRSAPACGRTGWWGWSGLPRTTGSLAVAPPRMSTAPTSPTC